MSNGICSKCGRSLTLDESQFSKGKYCWEHAARAYKFVMVKVMQERDELEQALQQANQPQPANQPQAEVKLVKKGD